ncbi:MAG: hypothetical protein HZY74_07190 [Brevundimonas sp.]|nr:MAG: hypothetical protein HZY74_07190 [Brevundimonas sp.]
MGQTPEEASTRFVEHVSAPPLGTRLARWNDGLCLSMRGGFPAALAQGLIDRIAMRAVELDIDVEGPGCRPNVFLYAGNDGAQLAQNLMARDPKLFQKHMHFGQDLGREALNTFLTSDAPVRWWQVTFPIVPSTGFVISDPPGDDPQTIAVHGASRVRSNIRYDLAWSVVVIETPQMRGVSLDALSDYVAMVVLAQIDPSADMRGYDSILNLFVPGNEQRVASQWDLDYLTALYRTSPDLMSPDQQTRWVAQRLARERREDEQP